MEEHHGYGGGRRSLRYEFSREPNSSTASLTLGGILSIKETASSSSYRMHNRTLLDLIRNDPTTGNDNNDSNKKPWKMFREKLRLCTNTVPIFASLVHINTVTDTNRTTTENGTLRSNSPSVSNGNVNGVAVTQPANSTDLLDSPTLSNSNTNSVTVTQTANNTNASSVMDTQTMNVLNEQAVEEENGDEGGGGGEAATVKVSLMRLLEVDGSACFGEDEGEEVVVEDGGGGGGYNNCCVCMVRHKGAAFIPCGHTFCRLCSRELFVKRANCPLCNNFISEILDIF